jgi:multidrug efflux pump subunit AcrB
MVESSTRRPIARAKPPSGDGRSEHRECHLVGGVAGSFGWRFAFILGRFIAAYDRFALRYEGWLDHALNHKLLVIGAAAVLFLVSIALFPLLGTELFPKTDAGEFVIQFRAPVGTRIELTEQLAERLENTIKEVIPANQLKTIVSNMGLAAPIDVQISGPHYGALFPAARQIAQRLKGLPQVDGTFVAEESVIRRCA